MTAKRRRRSTSTPDKNLDTLDLDVDAAPDQGDDKRDHTSDAITETTADGVASHGGAHGDNLDVEPSSHAPPSVLNLDRVAGLIVATAVGDALGWPQEDRSQIVGGDAARNISPRPEFRSWERSAGTQYGRYNDPVLAGEYSDDTQLMLAVARSCQHRDWLGWLTNVELPFWPVYQRGGGGAVLAASRSWAEGKPPWTQGATNSRSPERTGRYFDAGANGVAMRIAPHVVVTAHEPDETSLIRRVIADGITTHGHPRALLGGVIHALALRHALLQEETLEYGALLEHLLAHPAWRSQNTFLESLPTDWTDAHAQLSRGDTHQPQDHLWTRTCDEVEQLLNIAVAGLNQGATANDQRTLTDLGVYDKRRSGAGTVTAVAAAYVAARTASRPMSGLLRSGFLHNADTDTLCSMTGALLGATQGTGWLTNLFAQVQDREYLIDTAAALANIGDRKQALVPDSSPKKPSTATATRRWIKALFDGNDIEQAPDGRLVRVRSIEPLNTRTRQFMARAILEVADGQTLIVDRISKTPIPAVETARPVTRAVDDEPNRADHVSVEADTGGSVPTSAVTAVELRVIDVAQVALFLHRVFGLPVASRPNGRVALGTNLVLAPGTPADEPTSAVLHIRSADLKRAAARAEAFEGAAAQWADDGKHLWIREPSGLRVRASSP